MASLLQAEHKFNCGVTGLSKVEKMLINESLSSRTNENIETVKKMISDNRRIAIREIADDVGIL